MASSVARIKSIIDVTGTLAVIAVAGMLGWRLLAAPEPPKPPIVVEETKTRKPDPVPTAPISVEGLFSKGSPTAPVTVIEYGDIECPACAAFANGTYKDLVAQFVDTGQVRLMFKHFPLPKHQMAKPAAIVAQCAGQQGQFWQYYETAYTPGSLLSETFLRTTARDLKLNMAKWSACNKDATTAATVQAQLAEAMQLKLRATPAFLVGRVDDKSEFRAQAVLYGARDLQSFSDAIKGAVTSSGRPQ